MYTPHTVTVYNIVHETDQTTMKDVTTAYITVIRGVMLQASKAANVRQSGLEGADAVELYIPFSAPAVGNDGRSKRFAGVKEFSAATDKSGLWTLSVNDDTCTTIFIKGEVIEPTMTVQQLEATYDGVYKVTKVDDRDYGSADMRHWQVGGA